MIAEPTAFRLYLENNLHLPAAVEKGAGKLGLKYERLGGKCVFAFDQATRLLAIFHGHEVCSFIHQKVIDRLNIL